MSERMDRAIAAHDATIEPEPRQADYPLPSDRWMGNQPGVEL